LAKKRKTEKAPREMTRRQISAHRRQQRRQRFIFIGGIAIVVAIIAVIVAGWMTSEFIPLRRTVITVNDMKFTTGDFVEYLEIAAQSQKSSGQTPSVPVLASNALQQIPNDELMKEAAAKLGITVTEDDATSALKNAGMPVNNGSIFYVSSYLLQQKLRTDYFGTQVPQSDNQVWSNAMLLESQDQASEIRARLETGENFTALAPAYALNYYSKNTNKGDFGWHPLEVLQDQLGSDIPTAYAFSADVGSLSEPLPDEAMYKQLGYWLIKVLNQPSADSANVDAIFVSNEVLADHLRPLLEATDNISPIADNYTQYTPSKENHGHLGQVDKTSMSEVFDEYVFSDNVVMGDWSQPIADDSLWTQGGSWLVKVVDKAENKALSQEDRDYLIGKRLNAWISNLQSASGNNINTDKFTPDIQQWAIQRVSKYIGAGTTPAAQGQP
jgi:hypothetical protein